MTNIQEKSVASYHTSCLQDDMAVVPRGPGAFAVVLRSEFRIHSPYDAEAICLPVGTPLLGRAQVDSLSDEVHRHLHGSIAGSDLRLGVALFLGHNPEEGDDGLSAAIVRASINNWLGANTAFFFWPRTGTSAPVEQDGFFAGVARSWASRIGAKPALH